MLSERLTSAKPLTAMPAGRRLSSVLSRLLICVTAGLPASACSMSFPIAGFMPDTTATGSISSPDSLLFKALDQEDWRRAHAAMAIALDPQGNGLSVNWDNPRSGARGSFVAAAEPIASADMICRAFRAHIVSDPHDARDVSGSACRDAAGGWRVKTAAEIAKTRG